MAQLPAKIIVSVNLQEIGGAGTTVKKTYRRLVGLEQLFSKLEEIGGAGTTV